MKLLSATAAILACASHSAVADDAIGRYQMVPMAGGYGAMILDTTDGDLWRAWWPSAVPGQPSNPDGIAYVGRANPNQPTPVPPKGPDAIGR
jgi:hypothetical protein